MIGGLWEWLWDENYNTYTEAPNDGTGWCMGNCPVNAYDPNYIPENMVNRGLRGYPFSGNYIIQDFEFTLRIHSAPTTDNLNDIVGRLAQYLVS